MEPLFRDEELREQWLVILKYQPDHELSTYRGYLEAELDISFDWLQDQLAEGDLGVINQYIDYGRKVRAELAYLRQQDA